MVGLCINKDAIWERKREGIGGNRDEFEIVLYKGDKGDCKNL